MKLFKVNVDYGQYVYAAEDKQQLIDYLKERKDYAVCRYDSNIDGCIYLSDRKIDKIIVEVDVPEKGVSFIGGYQE